MLNSVSSRLILPENAVLGLASGNKGKLRELSELTEELSLDVMNPQQLGKWLKISSARLDGAPEEGVTYQQNADIKIRSGAREIRGSEHAKRIILVGDDSGHQLFGQKWRFGTSLKDRQSIRLAGLPFPGVDTHQFEEDAMDKDVKKICAYYNELAGPGAVMLATTVIAIRPAWIPEESPSLFFEGIRYGTLAPEPRGNDGFGYDSFFIPQGYAQTFGEMSTKMKNDLSPRRQALDKMLAAIGGRGTLDMRRRPQALSHS